MTEMVQTSGAQGEGKATQPPVQAPASAVQPVAQDPTATEDPIEKRIREAEERAFNRARSYYDKKMGVTAVQAQAPSEPPAAAVPSQAQPPAQTQAQEAVNPLTVLAGEIMDDEGIDITEDDPEAAMIKWADKASVRRETLNAIAAKRQRQAAGSLPLTGGTPVANPIADINDPYELLSGGFKDKR